MQYYTKHQHLALLLLRVILAMVFLVAAYLKLPFWSDAPEEMSDTMVNLTRFLSVVEPVAAIAVLTGFLARWAAAGLSVIMVGAIYVTRFVYGIGFVTPAAPGWNFPFTVLGACLILASFGAGRWSVDGIRNRRRI